MVLPAARNTLSIKGKEARLVYIFHFLGENVTMPNKQKVALLISIEPLNATGALFLSL